MTLHNDGWKKNIASMNMCGKLADPICELY